VTSAPTSAKTAPAVQGPAPAEEKDEPTLFGQISDYIAGAKAVKTLGAIADRIDVLVSEGQLTHDQAHDLTEEITKRHDKIEPKTAKEVAHAI
jgi:hypothetical protein